MLRRKLPASAYSLVDVAEDAALLVEKLGLGPVHVVGASMGGMIGQVLAAEWPDRVRSLVSIMSNTGSRWTGQPSFGAYRYFLARAPSEREAFIEHVLRLFKVIGSHEDYFDEDHMRELIGTSYDRDHDEAASGRQLGAILKTGNRKRFLAKISVPTLVIHGTDDRLVMPSGGRATAKAIPGARLMKIEGMGHDLQRAFWPQILDGIVENADRASGTARRALAA
jgi:pimeloyl-ACP methyl ester carboxylesterase